MPCSLFLAGYWTSVRRKRGHPLQATTLVPTAGVDTFPGSRHSRSLATKRLLWNGRHGGPGTPLANGPSDLQGFQGPVDALKERRIRHRNCSLPSSIRERPPSKAPSLESTRFGTHTKLPSLTPTVSFGTSYPSALNFTVLI